MLAVLHSLHALSGEDGGFVGALRELAFVPVGSGALRCAEQLFHPRVSEAAELLDGAEVFPHGAFAEAEALGVLERLGMRVTVTRSAVLRSAKAVEALAATGQAEVATRRARALLRFINVKLHTLPVDGDLVVAENEHSLVSSADESSAPAAALSPDDYFVSQLRRISWMPVLAAAPHPQLPWAARLVPIAPPDDIRPESDMWLVSHCLSILDGELRCTPLVRAFGWDSPPRPAVVCAQLVQFGSKYDAASAPAFLWETFLEPAYRQLLNLVDDPSFPAVRAMLASRPCLWIDRERGFLSPEHVIFDPNGEFAASSAYLARVPEAYLAGNASPRAAAVTRGVAASGRTRPTTRPTTPPAATPPPAAPPPSPPTSRAWSRCCARWACATHSSLKTLPMPTRASCATQRSSLCRPTRSGHA